jgi:glycosidase
VAAADVPGVMPGIPEPGQRNAIVQLFNWRFNDVRAVLPHLRELGYSHVHVSPREKSNERVRQWWGRYRPVDYATIEPATAPPTPKRRGRPPKARPAG